MAKPYLSIILRVKNGIRFFPFTLIELDRELEHVEYSHETLAVIEPSTDGTETMTTRFANLMPHLKLLEVNKEKIGDSLRQGLENARGNWRLLLPANNSISLQEFEKIKHFLTLEEKPAIILGMRKKGIPLIEKGIGLWLKIILGLKLKDPLTSFVCLGEEAGHKILPHLSVKNSAALLEIIIQGNHLSYEIKEVPIEEKKVKEDKKRIKDYLQIFWEIGKIRGRLHHKKSLPHPEAI